jgi:hypothetical protein
LAEASSGEKHWLDDDATFNAVLDLWQLELRKLTPPISKPIERRIDEGKKWIRKLDDGLVQPGALRGVLDFLRWLSQNTAIPHDVREEFATAVANRQVQDDSDLA